MTTIHRLGKSKLTMYAFDHNPPHFHVIANDGSEALVALATMKVIHGSVRSTVLKEAITWASRHASALAAKWKELNP